MVGQAEGEGPKALSIHGTRIVASHHYDPKKLHEISVESGRIVGITEHATSTDTQGLNESVAMDANSRIVTPSLCHAHVHLDKAFLTSDAKYADLRLEQGGFDEAMAIGTKAKKRFEIEDLMKRGKWLIAESVAAGVTHMRAFIEIDCTVEFECLVAAIRLKRLFADCCKIQICAFAQDPIFSGPCADENRHLFETACSNDEVEAIGSTPYVEDSDLHSKENLEWTAKLAQRLNKHLDFHLDYNIDIDKPVMARHFVELAIELNWRKSKTNKTMVLGHCTRLTLFSQGEWQKLSHTIQRNDLPIYFVGLPTSDLFIQGKPLDDSGGGERPRGTLQIPQMIQQYGLKGAISINNVGNAFTPQGTCDPLALASLGVGVYQAGTVADVQCLFECISSRAKEAIGFESENGIQVGGRADMIIYQPKRDNNDRFSQQRIRLGLEDLVYDPPKDRQVIFEGRLVDI